MQQNKYTKEHFSRWKRSYFNYNFLCMSIRSFWVRLLVDLGDFFLVVFAMDFYDHFDKVTNKIQRISFWITLRRDYAIFSHHARSLFIQWKVFSRQAGKGNTFSSNHSVSFHSKREKKTENTPFYRWESYLFVARTRQSICTVFLIRAAYDFTNGLLFEATWSETLDTFEIYEKLEDNWLRKINCRLHWTEKRFRYRHSFVCGKSPSKWNAWWNEMTTAFKSQLLTFARNSHFWSRHTQSQAIATQRPICLFVLLLHIYLLRFSFVVIRWVVFCSFFFLSCQSMWLPVYKLIFCFSHTNLHCCDLFHAQMRNDAEPVYS